MKAARMLHMNPYQTAIARQHGLGDFNDYPERENWRKDLDDCGDGLFRFMMVELAASEDCDSKAEAINRLNMAARDIEAAIAAVEALPDEEVH